MKSRVFYILPLVLLASACGKSLQSAKPTAGPEALGPAPAPTPIGATANKIIGPNGELSWSPQGAISIGSSAPLEFSYELKIPFAHVYSAASVATRLLSPMACQGVQGIDKELPNRYANGEVPCGQIIDGQWKRLLSVSVDPFYDNHEGFDVYVTGANIPVYLSRQARQGIYVESDLGSRGEVSKYSSSKFGEDISVKFSPTGAAAQLELCANVPGGEVTAPNQVVNAKAWRKVWGYKASYDSNFTISPGVARFDYGRGCIAANFGWSGADLIPALNFSVTKAPFVSNASYSGLYIYINDWFLRMIDRVMAYFKVSLRQKLTAQVVREANQIIDRDVETGQWFTKVHGPELIARVNDRLSQQISKVVTRVGIPATVAQLKDLIKDNCRIRRFAGGTNWTNRIETVCREVVEKIEWRIEPFVADPQSQALGCYSHFANIHQSSAWWGKGCKFSSRFSIKIPVLWKDYVTEVHALLAAHVGLNQIPQEWVGHIQNLKLDGYTMMLLLEELERRGFSQVVPNDWQSQIPGILAELKQRL